MLEKLTPEQEALIPIIRNKWINQLFDLKPLNYEQLKEGVKWLYTFCKMDIPKIIVCESILEAQLLVNTLKDNVGDNVRDNVWANVGDNVGANVWDNVWANVGDNVGANVWDNVRDNVGANVWDNVRDNVRANVWANVGDNVNTELFCSYGDINDYGWVSFHDFFTQIGVNKNENFNSFVKLLQSNYYTMIQMQKVCIVVKNPKHILLNSQKQMHSLEDYAIKFNDNTGMYFVNGMYLSDKLFQKLYKKEYTFENFTKESNEEIKSLILFFYEEKFGGEFVYRFLSKHLKEIDNYTHKKKSKYLKGTTNGTNINVYTLFKGNVNNINIAYIRCYCPSTDRLFFLGVHPDFTNAKDAIASLCQIPVKLKDNLISIKRQGEIFSFNFDKIGTEILKHQNLTKEDYQNVVSLKGNEYFSKIQYEY